MLKGTINLQKRDLECVILAKDIETYLDEQEEELFYIVQSGRSYLFIPANKDLIFGKILRYTEYPLHLPLYSKMVYKDEIQISQKFFYELRGVRRSQ